MKITHANALPMGIMVIVDGVDNGEIIGRRWRVNGELRDYIVRINGVQMHCTPAQVERATDV